MNPRIELCIAFILAFDAFAAAEPPRISRAVLRNAKRKVKLSDPNTPTNSGSHLRSSTAVAGRAVSTRSVGRSSSSPMANAWSK